MVVIPAEDFDLTDGATINPGDMLITGSADCSARSWSVDTAGCMKVILSL
jgi:WD40 repeat protein